MIGAFAFSEKVNQEFSTHVASGGKWSCGEQWRKLEE